MHRFESRFHRIVGNDLIYHLVKSRLKTMRYRAPYEHNEILKYFDLKKTWTHGSIFFLAGGRVSSTFCCGIVCNFLIIYRTHLAFLGPVGTWDSP